MGRREALGLEIRDDVVRAAAIRLQRQPSVIGYGRAEVVSGDDRHAQVVAAVRTALKEPSEGRLAVRDAYLSLPESKVFRKIVEIPANLPPEEWRAKVMEGIESFLPGEPDSMEMDFQIMPTSFFAKADPQVSYAAAVAVEKRIVQDLVAVLTEIKLEPKGIDTVPAALARAALAPSDMEPAVLIASEADQIIVTLVQRGFVWATGSVRGGAAEDPMGLAVAVADEVAHITKFYANRSGMTKLPKRTLLVSSFPTEFKKKLGEELDNTVKEGKPVLELAAGLDAMVALGAALYPLYQLIPDKE